MISATNTEHSEAKGGPDAGIIAYLTGEYPKVSHTFIQREIAALRALNARVITCSVRRPRAVDIVGADQNLEAERTFFVLEAARKPQNFLRAHLSLMWRAPSRWGKALHLALRMRPPGIEALAYQMFYFGEAAVLAEHLRRNDVRHLHNHFGDSSGTVTMLAAEMAEISFSYTMHGPTLFFEPMKWRLDEKTARARFVVCISRFCRSQGMLFSDQAHWPKLRIVHCGVVPALYRSERRETFGKRLLFVGRLAAAKGLPVLLEAFAKVRIVHPDATLTLVGDGPDRAALERQAVALSVADAVIFAGYRSQEEVAVHMAETDVFVLPSFAEGVPVVIMEAMASAVPVVATRVGGVEELVVSGETGIVVPPSDPDAFAEGVCRLLADPDLRRKMGVSGRGVVDAEFNVDVEASKLLAMFRCGPMAHPTRER